MSNAALDTYAISLGKSFQRDLSNGEAHTSDTSFISVKYNFKPPSIALSSPGYLHSTSRSNSQWSLEYDMREREEDRRGTRSTAQGFQGTQSGGKDVDCVLVWDDRSQSYVLDRVSSTFAFKYDRSHTKLSKEAKEGLSRGRSMAPQVQPSHSSTDALGLSLTQGDAAAMSSQHHHIQQEISQKIVDEIVREGASNDDDDDDEEDFARQLELGLEGFAADEEVEKVSSSEEMEIEGTQRPKTGLGLLEGSGLREDVLTPRGSPYIDRPKNTWELAKSNLGQSKGILANQMSSSTARSTPVVSPVSLANSPRPAGLDSALSASSTWRPPAQRSNVAIAYDEDEEEGDEESEEEEDDEEDEEDENEDEDEDGDLDDYARQLESSLQG